MYSKSQFHFYTLLFVTLVMAILALSLGCKPPAPPPTTKRPVKPTKTKKPPNIKKYASKGGFDVPVGDWAKWLANYTRNEALNKLVTDDETVLMDPNAPNSFKGIGGGHKGFRPLEMPPWGYKPRNLGFASLCYTPQDPGYCNDTSIKKVKRWAYNPYDESCKEFDYSGCRGNLNNFKKKVTCLEKCTKLEETGCRSDTDVGLRSGILLNRFIKESVPPEFLNIKRRCGNQPNV